MPDGHMSAAEPVGAKFLSLQSPAFAAEYPKLQGKQLMPDHVVRLLEPTWNTGLFPPSAVSFYRYYKVFVASDGLVFDRDLNVHDRSVAGHDPDEIAMARRSIRDRMANGSLPVHLRPAVLCKKRGSFNYGHFLVEMLSKAFLARRHLSQANLTYVVGAERGALGAVMSDALSMIDIDEEAVVRCDRQPAFFSELIVIDGLTNHGRFMSPLVMESFDRLAMPVSARGSERIYVTRASALHRKLLNEGQLASLLDEHGYAIVDPGAMPLAEQIAAFKAARRIIGVTGAALTNVAFARPGASVTCLTPASMPDTFFWFLSRLKNHRFLDVRLEELGGEPAGLPSWAGNVSIEADVLRELLSDP